MCLACQHFVSKLLIGYVPRSLGKSALLELTVPQRFQKYRCGSYFLAPPLRVHHSISVCGPLSTFFAFCRRWLSLLVAKQHRDPNLRPRCRKANTCVVVVVSIIIIIVIIIIVIVVVVVVVVVVIIIIIIIIIKLSLLSIFASVLFVHQPGANHAPGPSVTQVIKLIILFIHYLAPS